MSQPDAAKPAKKNTWPEERVELLKQLWTEGLSASQIATRLGDNITRNAVIGKIHRLGMSGRGTPTRVARPRTRRPRQPSAPRQIKTASEKAAKPETAKSRPSIVRKPDPAPVLVPPVLAEDGERITILSLTHKTCRWPIGDPGDADFCFCGHEPQAGTPYCDYHASLAYQPAADRRRTRKAANG